MSLNQIKRSKTSSTRQAKIQSHDMITDKPHVRLTYISHMT